MIPEEKALLSDFLARLTAARDVAADAEANLMIARAAEQQPAALYLAIQRAVWLEHALQEAQARIRQLEAAATPVSAGSTSGNPWLSSSWGSGADNGRVAVPPAMPAPMSATPAAAGWRPGYPAQGFTGNPGWQTAPGPGMGGFAPGPFGASPGFMGGGGSFLATAAATAAGVVAGEMIADAFTPSHHGHQSFADVPPESGSFVADDSSNSGGLGDFDSGSDSDS